MNTLDPATLEQIVLDGYPPTRTFAIISWGAAATSWLAWALNSHPDLYCVHAGNLFWHALGRAPMVDGPQYIRLLGSQGYAHVAAGDVHGVNPATVPAIRKEIGDSFRSAVLIRDPLPRLQSQFALFERYKHHRVHDVSHVDELIESLDLPASKADYERKLDIHGVNMLNAIIYEVDIGPVFTSESVTSDPGKLAELVRAVAGEDVKVEREWCQRAVASPRRNAHGGSRRDILSDPWLVEIISKVVKPQAWELYKRFGYKPPAFVKTSD